MSVSIVLFENQRIIVSPTVTDQFNLTTKENDFGHKCRSQTAFNKLKKAEQNYQKQVKDAVTELHKRSEDFNCLWGMDSEWE